MLPRNNSRKPKLYPTTSIEDGAYVVLSTCCRGSRDIAYRITPLLHSPHPLMPQELASLPESVTVLVASSAESILNESPKTCLQLMHWNTRGVVMLDASLDFAPSFPEDASSKPPTPTSRGARRFIPDTDGNPAPIVLVVSSTTTMITEGVFNGK